MQNINQAVAYLVAQGKPANLARAAINEYCTPTDSGVLTENTGDLLLVYNTAAEMLEVTPNGIMLDGELTFDLQGNYL